MKVVLISGFLVGLLASVSFSQTNPDHGELTHGHASLGRAEAALASWRAEHGTSWQLRYDHEVGQARFLFGGSAAPAFEPVADADFFSLARDVLAKTSDFHAVDPSTLEESFVRFLPLGTIGTTDKMAVEFQQVVRGVPVEKGWVNFIFDTRGYLLALDVQAQPNLADFPTSPSLKPERALEIAERTFAQETGLPITGFGQPELVIRQVKGERFRVPMLTWKVAMTHESADSRPEAFDYWIDAFTGAVLHSATRVHYFDVSGTMFSMLSRGNAPDTASNPPQAGPIPHMRVSNDQNNNIVYTDASGFFNIPGATPGVKATFVYNGLFTNTTNTAGVNYQLSQTLPNPTGNFVLMNAVPSEFATAQANSANWINLLRDYIRQVDPNDATADFIAQSNVNLGSTCNAYFNGSSVNFYQSGGGCVNTAYSSVVAHEMGHWFNVLYGTGNGPDGIGEGIADVFAMYLLDNPVVGFDFCGPGCNIRSGLNTKQFCGDCCGGCYGGVHADGEVIMGAMWKARRNLKNQFGKSAGSAIADMLFSSWNNGFNQTQIKNIMVEQWITLDDDDGNFQNGSPHYNAIHGGFTEQGFPGLALDFLDFANATELPDTMQTGPYTVDVDVSALLNPPVTSVSMFYNVDGGAFAEVSMANVGGSTYRASIPDQDCPSTVNYYFRATDSLGVFEDFPERAPVRALEFHKAVVTSVLDDDFENVTGWTAVNNGAIWGDWDRGVPVNDPNWVYDPMSDSDGSGKCYLTQNELGDSDVDGGSVTLFSPKLDLSGGVAHIGYDYYLRLTDSESTDALLVEISSNGMNGPWKVIADHRTDGGSFWRTNIIRQADLDAAGITTTDDMRVRFTANDAVLESIVEVGIDAFRAATLECPVCTDPVQYCTPKQVLVCGPPSITWTGTSSAGSASGFEIFAQPARLNKVGYLLYGNAGPAAIPFQGGTLCINPAPIFRTVPRGTTNSGGPCQGVFRIDMNAFASGALNGNPEPFLRQIGQTINVQWWGRDSVATGSFLSDALEYLVCP